MLSKIIRNFNLNRKFHSFKLIDKPLRDRFSVYLIYAFIVMTIGLITLISVKSLSAFLLLVLTSIGLFLYTYYLILKCYDNDISFIDGECVEISGKKIKRPYIVITSSSKDNNCKFNYIKIYTGNYKKATTGNILRFYFPKDYLRKNNEDTYTISLCYYFCVMKKNKIINDK